MWQDFVFINVDDKTTMPHKYDMEYHLTEINVIVVLCDGQLDKLFNELTLH